MEQVDSDMGTPQYWALASLARPGDHRDTSGDHQRRRELRWAESRRARSAARTGRRHADGTVSRSWEPRPDDQPINETHALFTSGFSGASAPSAVITDSVIKVDLSSLFFSVNQGNAYRLWNIGTVVTGLYNPTSKEFALSWDRVLGENCQQGQASFFLNGLVHFDSDVQPVPIPAAAWLFGSGIAGIAALVRRRNTH